jgi:tetratricopeptide (TPR) repeat protein
MRIRFQALAIAPLIVAMAGLGCARVQARAAFKDGNKAYVEENFRQAIEHYERAIELDPSITPAYFYLASSYQALFRPAKDTPENDQLLVTAIDLYKKTLEVTKAGASDTDKQVRMNTLSALTSIYSEEPYRNFDTAISYANELVQEKPDDIHNLFAMANLYERFDHYEEAEATYRRAADVDASDITACGALAAFYNKPLWDGQSKFDEAIATLQRCANLVPDDPTGFYKVASFYWDKAYRDPLLDDEQKNEYADHGLEAVEKALQLKPDYIDALVYKGLLFRVKAQVTQDRRERFQYLDQAQILQKQALELKRQEQAEAEEAARAAAAG